MGEYNNMMPELNVTELPYELGYWSKFPVNSNMNFSEGKKLPVLSDTDGSTLKEMRIWTQKRQQQMKNEITQLTWKSIQPIP